MSYLRANKVDQEESAITDEGFSLPDVVFAERPTIDCNLDDEQLDFVLALIKEVNELREGEALVVWKEIF